jgi:hypothetical protein
MRENPYKCTGPLDPEKDQLVCIPRHEEVERVAEGLKKGEYWVVIGPAQIGKTTFLRQVAYKYSNAYNIYLNLKNSPGDMKDFYQWMIDQLLVQIPIDYNRKLKADKKDQRWEDYDPEEREFLNFLKAFQHKGKIKKLFSLIFFKIFQPKVKHVVLFLDEVENISFLDKFLHLWRKIHTDKSKVTEFRKYSIIMTGSAKLDKKAVGFTSPLNIAKTLYLEDFSYQQSRQIIDEPFRQLGLSIDEKAKEKLIHSVDGQPQLLQQCCHFLVQCEPGKDKVIVESDINYALAHVLKTNPVLYTLKQDIKTDKTLCELVKRILDGEQIKCSQYREFSYAGAGPIKEGPDSFCAIRNEVFKEFFKSVLLIPKEKEQIISSEKILIEKPSKNDFLDSKNKKPMHCAIKQIQVRNYHGIIETGVHLPVDARWIFLTGENSYGKTAILRALTIGLFGSRDQDTILFDADSKSEIAVEIYQNGKNLINIVGDVNFKTFGYFASYGSSRLVIQSDRTTGEITGRSTKTYSMFNADGVSLNIERELVLWYLDKDPRYDIVRDILLKLLPHSADIIVDRKNKEVLYTEKENIEDGGSTFDPIPFHKLAAGNKSIIAMIGDLSIRFYKEYEKDGLKDTHPIDFEGIVIIDELDLHLHPKWLRRLPAILSRLFPKIQFIAATHSEIPLLGAPKDSVFLKVTRTQKEGIRIERVDVDFKNLLPHHLLTSPIFGLDEEIIPEANERLSDMKTLDNYYESLETDEMMDKLRKFEESYQDFPDDSDDID